ncbi:hypothetical protein HMPREF9711_01396 [Myroides odoratimimus CCUG 3837]|uniref:hypothetical protein n=1 Tax=Myroides odoratimimus TaxID=76832 RepID=UPI000280AACB|nr:hypothetical protein [Myroides odoratimimus]EKB05261.1 hypothetical protein HMPREF9711_01396 [Myroides odoratimimus CCUG 3837]
MKKKVITIGMLMMAGVAFSQVGVGIRAPHKSALLELKASEGEYRGVLIPRIPLKNLTDVSEINKGDVATSLLVFNTTTNNVLSTGFYYWSGAKWVRLINNQDIIDNIDTFPRNKVLEVRGDVLVLEDTKGLKVDTPIQDLNIITTIKEGENGSYVYKNEAGEESVINITGSVIDNITEILNNTEVKEEIYNTVAAQGKAITAKDNSITLVGGSKAVLEETQIAVADGGITTEKIAAGGNKQILITNAKGEVEWVDASDEVIIDAVKNNETVTVLLDKGNGTFEYYNEKAIDAKGNLIADKAVKFNANTLSIVEREKEKGIYDFFDGEHKDTPLMTISTRANSIYFDNSSTTIEGDNLQEVIENIITKIEVAQGTPSSIKGGTEILINGEKELADAVLKDMTLSIAPGAITTEKIEAGGKKQILITNAKGEVVWVDASDEVIIDAVKNNETVTVLVDKGNGTFEYYNEKAIDAKGNLIEDKAVKFNANTLSIVEREGKEKGVYDFFDGEHKDTPLMTISTRANSIYFDNSSTTIEGDNLQEVIENIITKIEVAQGTPSSIKGGTEILINGETELADAVLKDMTLSIAPGAITTEKIEAGGNKQILITNAKGEVVWVDASDEVIIDAVKNNETVTVLVDHNNGKLSYYNEKAIDAKGNLIEKNAMTFDSNTLKIVAQTDGTYAFYDGRSKTEPVGIVDVPASVITNIEEILNDESVVNVIYDKVAAKGKEVTSVDGSIQIDNGDQATLNAMQISIAEGGVTPNKIQAGGKKQILITNAEGKVEWVEANEEVIKEVVQNNERITRLEAKPDGTFMYYNELAVNEKGEIIGEGVEFDANTLSIEESASTPGIYTFSDKKGVIKDLDIRASNIIIDDTTIGSGNDNVQDILETIFEIINNIDSQKRDLKGKGILVNGGALVEKALLAEVELSIDDKAITTTKLDTKAVTNAKVADHAITEDKLWAGEGREKQVAVVQADGSVKFQELNAVVTGKMLSVDNSLLVEGDASNALLQAVDIKVNDLGIVTKHIDHNAVTADKIGSEDAVKGSVLMAQGNGNSSFVTPDSIIEGTMHADLKGDDETIKVTNGENVLFGDKDKEVKISIIGRGVKGGHIATQTIIDENIADTTITATKLNGGINNVNAVATVIDNEGTVAYQPLKGDAISDKASLKSDGIIIINGVNQQEGTLLKETTLGIAPKGINTIQIADNAVDNLQIADLAVSSDKITSGTVGTGRVLLSDVDGKTKWGELDDITTQLAGDLTTDEIIKLTSQDGDGVKALLKDVKLSVNNNSITKDKLSSKENDVPVGKDKILVTNDKGGFDYVSKGAFESGGEDLYVGSALEFVNSDGLNAVLVETTIDVKDSGISTGKLADGAVTIEKITSGAAKENTVLTADGKGNVEYRKLADSAFEEQGKDLKGDNSIAVTANNKALLSDATISIAESGVQTKHITGRAVTADKIGAEGTSNGLVLVTKDGGAEFSPISDAIAGAGKEIKGGSAIEVTKGNKAALQDVSIDVTNLGITNAKIAERTIQASKFDAKGNAVGTVLTSLGDGEAKYMPINQYAKPLKGDSSIEISTDKGVLLADATIKVKDSGIDTKHLGAKVVTTEKISSKVDDGVANRQQILMADGQGGVYFGTSENVVTKGNINEGTTISATKGATGAVLQDVTLEVKGLSIDTGHIKDNAISPAKINTNAVTEDKIDTNAVTSSKIANNAVTTDKIANDNVTNYKILDGAVTTNKMSAGNATIGHVLTVEKDGKVAFKASDVSKGNIKESKTIKADNGINTVLKDVTLEIKGASIQTGHIADNAVTHNEIGDEVIYGRVIANQGIDESKIDAENAKSGQVLMANSNGGAYWGDVKAGTEISTGDFLKSNTIEAEDGSDALLKDIKLEIKLGSIETQYIADNAVGTAELKDESVTSEKVSSHGARPNEVLTSDGSGGAHWAPVSGGSDTGSGDLEDSKTIEVASGDGEGALFNDIKLEVKNASIENKHIVNESIRVEKISSYGASEFEVMVSDGDGGARWEKPENVIASPKFFYLPAIYVEVVSGQSNSIELYDEYKEQFGSPMLSSNGKSSLPVYGKYDLNYYVTYYDKNVFDDVKLDNDGELHYKVKQGAKPTGRTFFNIVLEVK